MKKMMSMILLPAIFVAMAACSRQTVEQEMPDEGTVVHSSISAYMVNPTGEDAVAVRTGYQVDLDQKKAVFAWLKGDEVDAVVNIGTAYTGVRFVSQEAGDRVQFKDGQTPEETTLQELINKYPGTALAPWAFYPSRGDAEAKDNGYGIDWDIRPNYYDADKDKYPGEKELITVRLRESVTPPVVNPLTVVPMFGMMDKDGEYAFTPMTAVLAVPVRNLTSAMDFISVESEDASLAGSFHVIRGEKAGWITQESAVAPLTKQVLHFTGFDGDRTFYFPIPAGTIPAGHLTLKVGASGDADNVMTITTKKDLVLQTGHITLTPEITFTTADQKWADYVSGSYLDDFLWSQHSWTATQPVPVTIQRSGLHPEKYRIANPYDKACEVFSYVPYTDPVVKDDYLTFVINEDGSVYFPAFRTGIEDKVSGGKLMQIIHPKDWGRKGTYNYLVSSTPSGEPLEVQLAAVFAQYENPGSYMFSLDGEGSAYTSRIHIVFDQPESWDKVADGTYRDNFIIQDRWGGATDTKVPVEIYKNSLSGTYRIANPYPALATSIGFDIPVAYTGEVDPYIYFSIGDEDAVTFVEFSPGIGEKNGSKELSVCYPADWNSKSGDNKNSSHNKVLGHNFDGSPTAVQFAPIYHERGNYIKSGETGNYLYSRDGYDNIIVIEFPQDSWTSLGTGRYTDEWLWTANGFAPYDVEVEVWRSNGNPNLYRVANPYAVANTAFKREGAEGGGEDYLYLLVDPTTGEVSFGSFVTGMTRDKSGEVETNTSSVICNWAIADKAAALSILGKSIDASKVVSGSAVAPEKIRLCSAYYDNNDATYFYSNSTGYKYFWFPGAYNAGETWSDFCEGSYQDAVYDLKINNSVSSVIGTVPVTIQQSSVNANRFRIANPYRENVDASLRCETFDEYLYLVVGNGLVYFEPFNTGVTFDASPKQLGFVHTVALNLNSAQSSRGTAKMTNSAVKSYLSDGTPKSIELGAFYYDIATPNFGYNYPRHNDTQYLNQRIFISFNATDKARITPYQLPMKPQFHNPVESLDFPTGSLDRLVIKVTGVDPKDYSKIGLRLYQSGWMDAGYMHPDANGLITMTEFNQEVTGLIDLNCWLDDTSLVGSAIRFIVQEVVIGGVSLPVAQDTSIAHYPGVVVNTGGDVVNVARGEVAVNTFRIPALVTSNQGTLIAAYDIRYQHSGDLVADIDVGVKRSTDGGKTWSDLIVAMDMGEYGGLDERQNGIGDPCLLVDENTGELFCFAIWAHGHGSDPDTRCLAWAGKGFEIEDTPQFMMVKSSDDGKTWSEPISITRQIKQPEWLMTYQGPGRGITMKDGTLVIPMHHQECTEKIMYGLYPFSSGVAYSTDHGLTWHTHNSPHPLTTESTVAEIAPGKLLLSMRYETDAHARRNFYTTDLGRTWVEHESNGQWLDSTCEASMIHVDADKNCLGKDILLFSNPNNTGRSRMSIRISYDQGATFDKVLLLDEWGSLGYSCLTMLDENTVGILYESSRAHIMFQAIPLTEFINE